MTRLLFVILLLCFVYNDARRQSQGVSLFQKRLTTCSNTLNQLGRNLTVFCRTPGIRRKCSLFCQRNRGGGRSVLARQPVPSPSTICNDSPLLATECRFFAQQGFCSHKLIGKFLQKWCKKSCPPLECTTVPTTTLPLQTSFKIYNGYDGKCLKYKTWFWYQFKRIYTPRVGVRYQRVRYKKQNFYTAGCSDTSVQTWQWSPSGQLSVTTRTNQRLCLTLSNWQLSMKLCQPTNRYQRWTCSGKTGLLLKLKDLALYVWNKRRGSLVTLYSGSQSTTGRNRWYQYGTHQSICSNVVKTTPRPPTTKPTTMSTTKAIPPTPPPPVPTTMIPTPPAPAPTTMGPPPPGNLKVKCGTKGKAGLVVNGTISKAGSWPWYVGIKECSHCNITCGGTLISDQWVVTAGHCIFDPSFPLYLQIGEIDQGVTSGNEQSFTTTKIIVHKKFDINVPFDYDIALLRLDKYAVYNNHVRPLCLPDSGKVLDTSDHCTVTGFGKTTQGGVKSAQLREANVGIVSRDTCKKDYMKILKQVTDRMICAGFTKGGTDACQGDSGGPLTCHDRANSRFFLGGIVSWGVGCAQPNKYGVYTNTPYLVDWVNQTLAMH